MKYEFDGYLPFTVKPEAGDKLVISPIYVFPVEILERGILIRPSYRHCTVLVNGFSGRAELLERKELSGASDFDQSGFECRMLELKISPENAAEIAVCGATPENYRSWRKAVRNRNVAVMDRGRRLMRHVYAIRGSSAVDTFTGRTMDSAGLLDFIFPRAR